MVKIRIQKGDSEREIECRFASITFAGYIMAQFEDPRRLPEIAAEMDHLDCVTVIESLTEKAYAGFGLLSSIERQGDAVTIRLEKEDAHG